MTPCGHFAKALLLGCLKNLSVQNVLKSKYGNCFKGRSTQTLIPGEKKQGNVTVLLTVLLNNWMCHHVLCQQSAVLHKSSSHQITYTFLSLFVLQSDSMTSLANREQNLPAADMYFFIYFFLVSVLVHAAKKALWTIESIEGELFCLKLSDENATLLMSSSDGQAVKVCWVIKGYALNTVPFLLVTCRQLHTYTICVDIAD